MRLVAQSPDFAAERDRRGSRGARAAVMLALASLSAALGACSSNYNYPLHEPTLAGALPYDGYRNRHPLLLTEKAETIDIPVGSQGWKLTEAGYGTVVSFARTARERGASGITILVPAGSANEGAAYHVSRQIAQALVAGGIAPSAITHRPYRMDKPGAEPPIRLSYPRIVAGVPHACGQWPDQVATQPSNQDYWNFGCATQANIGAMVVEPSDLVTMRGEDAVDASRRASVIDKYRKGQDTKSEIKPTKQSIVQVGSGG